MAVARNHHFSATVRSAQGLCETHSVSQTPLLFHFTLLQQPGRKERVLLWSTITLFTQQMDTEIGTCLWTWLKGPLQSAGALYWKWGEGACTPPAAIRWISSHALKCPSSRSGENESWERINHSFPSRSLVHGHFLSGLANCNNLCRNNHSTNPIWPAFFSSLLQCRRLQSLTFVLPCWKQSMNWWPYESQKNPANHCGKSRPRTWSMTAGLFPSIFPFSFFLLCRSLSQSFLPTSVWSCLRAANFSRIVFMCC